MTVQPMARAAVAPLLAVDAEPGNLIVRNGQVQYGNLLMGAGTAYSRRSLDGWRTLPGMDSGSVPRPARHGSWPGRLLAQPRVVTIKGHIRTRREWFGQMVADLEGATVPGDDATELGLAVREHGQTFITWGQCTGRDIPGDLAYGVGIASYTVQIECSDARKYGAAEKVVALGEPVSTGGLTWPLSWPLNWGTTISGGARTAVNAGKVPTHPRIRIPGPRGAPRATNRTTGGVLEFGIALAAGEYLDVDTNKGTAKLNGTADRAYSITGRSWPIEAFTLIPGGNDLALSSAGTGADVPDATVTWRDAYM